MHKAPLKTSDFSTIAAAGIPVTQKKNKPLHLYESNNIYTKLQKLTDLLAREIYINR